MLAFAALASCSPASQPNALPSPDYEEFVAGVEPELAASCGFLTCHGAPLRPFRLYSPASSRLRPNVPAEELIDEEHRANYDRTRVWLAPTAAELPDLLRKPLQRGAGGAEHAGVDRFGQNVYAGREDPRWQLLLAWAEGKTMPAADGRVDAGEPGDGGAPTCAGCAVRFADVSRFINPQSCGDGASCHKADSDAGCGYPNLPAYTRDDLLASGCPDLAGRRRPEVTPCASYDWAPGDPPAFVASVKNRLFYYATKDHSAKFGPSNPAVLQQWIQCGALP
ncbi:MAG: hypothetical protein ACYC8T_13275 [Myxococcaceae bacterium]